MLVFLVSVWVFLLCATVLFLFFFPEPGGWSVHHLQHVVFLINATTTTTTGLVSVLVCAAVLFAATTDAEGDAKLLNKMEKMNIVKGKKILKNTQYNECLDSICIKRD